MKFEVGHYLCGKSKVGGHFQQRQAENRYSFVVLSGILFRSGEVKWLRGPERYPRGLVGVDRSSSGHGGELSWWVPPLIYVVHPLVTIDCGVPRLVTNLTCWARAGVWVPRLGILRVVEITSASTVVILKTSSSTSMLVVTASTSSSVSIELALLRRSSSVFIKEERAYFLSYSTGFTEQKLARAWDWIFNVVKQRISIKNSSDLEFPHKGQRKGLTW
uniref:Uncharacterized protein n=1 Tax=Fagus sylvatica TaxID=28930 RepID=A0A2N9HCB1_FAGSY